MEAPQDQDGHGLVAENGRGHVPLTGDAGLTPVKQGAEEKTGWPGLEPENEQGHGSLTRNAGLILANERAKEKHDGAGLNAETERDMVR